VNYGTPAKTDRNAALIRIYLKAPTTLQALGDKYGISRERVRQILARNNVTFRYPTPDRERKFDHGAIAERYRTTSLTAVQIAQEFGCSNHTVSVAMAEYGIKWEIGRSHYSSITDPSLAVKMYEAGKTCACIAAHFDCSASTAAKFLRGRGIKMRRPGNRKTKVPWAQHEIESMLAMLHDGMTQTAIGRALGRGQANVSQKLARLRKEGVAV